MTCALFSLDFVSTFVHLEVLDVSDNWICDLSPLLSCVLLQSLCLQNTHVSNLEVLKGPLKYLDTREIDMSFIFYGICSKRKEVINLLDSVSSPFEQIYPLFFSRLESVPSEEQRID
ncbi:hypothetical protein RCL1_002514 [Eukaryota sp. TZLM3-RCL]